MKEPEYTRQQLLKSKTFAGQAQVLAAVLSKDKTYTKKQAATLVKNFLLRSVN
jgi:hypothetical protein